MAMNSEHEPLNKSHYDSLNPSPKVAEIGIHNAYEQATTLPGEMPGQIGGRYGRAS